MISLAGEWETDYPLTLTVTFRISVYDEKVEKNLLLDPRLIKL